MNPEKTGQYLRQDPLDSSERRLSLISDVDVLRVVGTLIELQEKDTRHLRPGQYSIATPLDTADMDLWDEHFGIFNAMLAEEERENLFVVEGERTDVAFPDINTVVDRIRTNEPTLEFPKFVFVPMLRVDIEGKKSFDLVVGLKDDNNRWVVKGVGFGDRQAATKESDEIINRSIAESKKSVAPFMPFWGEFSIHVGKFYNLGAMFNVMYLREAMTISINLPDPRDLSTLQVPTDPKLRLVFWQIDKLIKQGQFPLLKPKSQGEAPNPEEA